MNKSNNAFVASHDMLDDQQRRVQRAMSNLIEDVYKSHLKKIQKHMHLCAAKCCDDKRGNLESVQHCIEFCARPMLKAQDQLQSELGQFQGRLQNCVMECGDEARQFVPANPTDNDMRKYQFHFDRCAVRCVDKHLNLMPALLNSIKTVLERGSPKNHFD